MDTETKDSVPRRLQRRSDDRVVAGVAGGLGDYTGVDPIVFRIGFIVLTLAGASGLLLYALAWIFIPEEGRSAVGHGIVDRFSGHKWLAVAFVVIGALFLSEFVHVEYVDSTLFWAVALAAIGFVLLKDEPAKRSEPAAETTALPAREATPRRISRPRRHRSPLGFMTLGAAFVVLALASSLMASSVVELDPGRFVALVVMTLGAGLVVGAWWGRARLLIVLGILLVPVMVVASMIDVPIRGSINGGYIDVRPRELRDEYTLLAGTMQLDLSRFDFGDTPTEIDVTFVAGDVEIYVPPGVEVEVNGEVDLGVADVFGDGSEGEDLKFGGTYQRNGLTEGSLVLNIDGGLGSFDTTWATWVDREERRERRMKERKERRREQRSEQRTDDRRDRKEAARDGRGRDRN